MDHLLSKEKEETAKEEVLLKSCLVLSDRRVTQEIDL